MTLPGALTRLAALVLLAAAPGLLSTPRTSLLTQILTFGLFAASLDLLIGYTGLPSLGHAAYYGVGAYAVALVGLHVTPNAFAELGIAVGVTAVVAAVTGFIAVRSRGVYLLMLTLAYGELLSQLALNWTSVTQGSNGLYGVPNSTLTSGRSYPLDAIAHPDRFYYYVLGAFLLGYATLRVAVGSPFGRALVGIRENESRMPSLGYNVALYKLGAFCLAGAIAGFAGGLAIQQEKYASPDVFSLLEYSALGVVALIIGGRGTLLGAVLGGAFIYSIRYELSGTISQHWMIVLGGIFVAVVYLLPQGLVGGGRAVRDWVRRRLAGRRLLPQEAAS
jgi:branched-chain amino acid transport system permease protein